MRNICFKGNKHLVAERTFSLEIRDTTQGITCTSIACGILHVESYNSDSLFCYFRGTDNVIGVESTLRCNDSMVFVLPYFPHQKFQVIVIIDLSCCK